MIFANGDRVGIAWVFSACGTCRFCRAGNENLCPDFKATGRDANGGYAEYMTVPEAFCAPHTSLFSAMPRPHRYCAPAQWAIDRLRLTGMTDGQAVGLAGFGASGHLVLKMVRHRYPASAGSSSLPAVPKERDFCQRTRRGLGRGHRSKHAPKCWTASSIPPRPGNPWWKHSKSLAPGGRLVINAIGKEDWGQERTLATGLPFPPVDGKRNQECGQCQSTGRARISVPGQPRWASGPNFRNSLWKRPTRPWWNSKPEKSAAPRYYESINP